MYNIVSSGSLVIPVVVRSSWLCLLNRREVAAGTIALPHAPMRQVGTLAIGRMMKAIVAGPLATGRTARKILISHLSVIRRCPEIRL